MSVPAAVSASRPVRSQAAGCHLPRLAISPCRRCRQTPTADVTNAFTSLKRS
uniref:Adriamycin-resistant related protein n=1 Tax=Mus musculus TaxID=10090 RepID=Q9Z2P0_MOUSE|nr:adriamycin-resistant related protein [Mus musculus]